MTAVTTAVMLRQSGCPFRHHTVALVKFLSTHPTCCTLPTLHPVDRA